MPTAAEYATAQQQLATLAASKVPALPDPDGFPQWAQQVAEIITLGGRAAGAMAVQRYLADRAAAGKSSRYTPAVSGIVPVEQIVSSLQWAAGAPQGYDSTAATRTAGIVNRYVLAPARDTTIAAATDDPVATKVARVPRAGACDWCLLMASRGAVYHSTSTAGRNANSRFVGDGEYKFHDHCHCDVHVVWSGQDYTPPEHVREAEDIYAAATRGVDGTKAKLAAFRAAMTDRRG